MSLADRARAFTFDCYGTLIDWERGIGTALDEIPALAGVDRDAFLRRREAEEMAVEAEAYRPYDAVLALSLVRAAESFNVGVTEREARRFGASVPEWPPLPDAAPFLRRLRRLNKPLAILSNVTKSALRASVRGLGVPFDLLVSAEDVRAYKPAPQHWLHAQAALGVGPGETLHIAASMVHDIHPAGLLGMPAVWVNRRGESLPHGSLAQGVEPALVVNDLAELAEALGLPQAPSR